MDFIMDHIYEIASHFPFMLNNIYIDYSGWGFIYSGVKLAVFVFTAIFVTSMVGSLGSDDNEMSAGAMSASIVLIIGLSGYVVYDLYFFDYTKAIDSCLAHKNYDGAQNLLSNMRGDGRTVHEGTYQKAASKVFKCQKEELLRRGSKASLNKLAKYLGERELTRPILGHNKHCDIEEANNLYTKEVEEHNQCCNEFLSHTIEEKDFGMARKVVGLFRPTLSTVMVEWHLFTSNEENVSLITEAKERAKARLDKAISAHRDEEDLSYIVP